MTFNHFPSYLMGRNETSDLCGNICCKQFIYTEKYYENHDHDKNAY